MDISRSLEIRRNKKIPQNLSAHFRSTSWGVDDRKRSVVCICSLLWMESLYVFCPDAFRKMEPIQKYLLELLKRKSRSGGEKQGKAAFQLLNSSVNETKINVNNCLFSTGHYESWCRTHCWGDLLKQEKNYLCDDIPLWRWKINLGGVLEREKPNEILSLSFFY